MGVAFSEIEPDSLCLSATQGDNGIFEGALSGTRRCIVAQYCAILEGDDLVSEFKNPRIMGDHDRGGSAKPAEIFQQRYGSEAARFVQGGGGLVRKNHLGIGDECSRYGDSLLLPARKIGG